MVPLVTYTEGIPEFLQTVRIHSVYVKEAAHSFQSPALERIKRFNDNFTEINITLMICRFEVLFVLSPWRMEGERHHRYLVTPAGEGTMRGRQSSPAYFHCPARWEVVEEFLFQKQSPWF